MPKLYWFIFYVFNCHSSSNQSWLIGTFVLTFSTYLFVFIIWYFFPMKLLTDLLILQYLINVKNVLWKRPPSVFFEYCHKIVMELVNGQWLTPNYTAGWEEPKNCSVKLAGSWRTIGQLFSCDVHKANSMARVFNSLYYCNYCICMCSFSDIDECAVNNGNCNKYGNCKNFPASYNCSCISGYFGDGFNCSGVLSCMW